MTEILLPANFGLSNLKSKVHGNITLVLSEGDTMSVNSLILSLNSPVFKTLFSEIGSATVDFRDSSCAAVKTFIKALYSGMIRLETILFREINKMSHFYKVAWLVRRCDDYFAWMVEDMDVADYNDVFYILEEVIFQKDVLGHHMFLSRVVDKIKSSKNERFYFLDKYLNDYTNLTRSQIDLAVDMAGDNACLVVKIVIANLENKNLIMDEVSKYIITKVDLLDCLRKKKFLFEDLFDLLFEKVQNVPVDDLKVFLKLYRKTHEDFNKTVKDINTNDKPQRLLELDRANNERSSESKACNTKLEVSLSANINSFPSIAGSDSSVRSRLTRSSCHVDYFRAAQPTSRSIITSKPQCKKQVLKKNTQERLPLLAVKAIPRKPKQIPNIFHSGKSIQSYTGLKNSTLEDLIFWDSIKNMMMLLEALPYLKTVNVKRAIAKLTAGQKARDWPRVPASFLDTFLRYPHSHLIEQVKRNTSLSSSNDTLELVSVNYSTLRDIVKEEQNFSFRHPDKSSTEFVLQTVPASTNTHFTILLMDASSEVLGHSSDQISVDRMHLVFKEWDSRIKGGGQWVFFCET